MRLVTLVGPPGAGKTRLAVHVAQSLGHEFAHGLVFVDLVPVDRPTLVAQAVAAALGVREMGTRDLVESVHAVLRDQEMLLLLDNFEHVLGAALFVEDLLRFCPAIRILATSREALRLPNEHSYRVPPLPVPRPDDMASLRRLGAVPSVRLFSMRARAVRNDWVLDGAHAPAVAELCRRLDGLPLAIELAAAWTDVLSPAAVLARLEHGIDERRLEQPTLPDRHRSLTDAIAWSHDLLSAQERLVFERSAVFVGGWTLSAADAVCGDERLDVLSLLAGLVNKHLVTSREQPDGEPRFDMLVTLRAHARKRLVASGEETDIRRRHALYYSGQAEGTEPTLAAQRQRELLDELETEFDNLRAALGYAFEAGDVELALRLAGALWFFWDMRGHLSEGRTWLERLLSHPTQSATPGRVSALNALGWIALVGGDYAAARASQESALKLARQLGDEFWSCRSSMHLAIALGLGSQEYDRALMLYAEALPIARARGDLWTIGLTLYGQGHIAALRGDLDQVNRLWTECFTICEGLKNWYALSYLQFRWGVLALQQGALDRAHACLLEALRFGDEVDSAREMGVAMDALAWVAAGKGESARAARLFGAAEALLDHAGYNLPPFMASAHEDSVATTRAALGDHGFDNAFKTGRRMSRADAILAARGEKPPTRHYAPLTEREWQVARLVAEGQTNKQIAFALDIADRTVITHLEHIFAKLQMQTRAQVAVWAAGKRDRAVAADAVGGDGPAERSTR